MTSPGERDQQAAYWYLKLQEPDVSAEEIQAGLNWLEASAENSAAFERVEACWRARPDTLPAAAVPVASEISQQRMGVPQRAIAAAVVLAVAGLLAWLAPQWYVRSDSEYVTAAGEHRTVLLDDASQVVLGGATVMRSDFTSHTRRVELAGGEALFRVASNPQRPFRVDVPNGSVRVLGTTFNVHHGPDGVTITVLEGTVQVDSRREASSIRLPAGAEVSLSTDGRLGTVAQADPRQAVAWSSGRLIFVDRSLRSVLADLNRYSLKPITLRTNDSTGDTHLTGTVQLDDIEQYLEVIAPIARVRVVENEHEFVLVAAKSAGVPGSAR